MDIGPILHLIHALKEHPQLGQEIAPKYFFDLLNPIKVSPSSKFYYEIGANTYHLPNKSGQSRVFSIDLILRNHVAREYKKKEYRKSKIAAFKNHILPGKDYDPVELSRMLRKDSELVKMMADAADNNAPYSAIGRVETFDDSTQKFERRPIIAIPTSIPMPKRDVDLTRLVKWETANTQYGLRDSFGRETLLTGEQYSSIR